MTSNNIARPAFEIPNKGGSSSDYLTNKKSRVMYCNRTGTCNNKGVKSYAEKNLISIKNALESPIETVTYDLHSNLETQLNYENVKIITDMNSNTTCINMGLLPLYQSYKIDTDGIMFGKTVCAENNYVNYRERIVPLPKQTVYWN